MSDFFLGLALICLGVYLLSVVVLRWFYSDLEDEPGIEWVNEWESVER